MTGLTPAGLEIKRLADIRSDLEARVTAAFGPATRVGPDSVIGQLIGVFALELSLVWELAQQLYDAFDPDQAEGTQLDNLAAIVGVARASATFSVGEVVISGASGALIPSGSIVEVSSTGVRFETAADATIGVLGSVIAPIRAIEKGPLIAPTGSIDTIVTPVAGWSSVTNAQDVIPGRNADTDEQLRLRREQSLQITGAAVDLAIRAGVLGVVGVAQASVVSNRTNEIVNGIPPKSFETIVYPDTGDLSTSLAIADKLFRLQPAGIQAFGSSEFEVTDAQGYAQRVGFTYASEIDVYVKAVITKGFDYPANGDDLVRDAILSTGSGFSVGQDVLWWRFAASLDAIPGILNVSVTIGTAPSPSGTSNIAIDFRSIATFDSSRIEVLS